MLSHNFELYWLIVFFRKSVSLFLTPMYPPPSQPYPGKHLNTFRGCFNRSFGFLAKWSLRRFFKNYIKCSIILNYLNLKDGVPVLITNLNSLNPSMICADFIYFIICYTSGSIQEDENVKCLRQQRTN